jgi:penicillin V acylase-like amidase (Ntn superfamily)
MDHQDHWFHPLTVNKQLRNTEGPNKNEQSRETGNIEYTRWRKTKQKHNTTCVGHHYTKQTQIM